MRRLLAPTLLAAILVVAAACGDDDTENTSSAARDTIDVAMVDNAYEPTEIEVPVGEEITFVFDNGGAALHEAYIGDEEAQEEHAMAMAEGSGEGEMDGMDHGGGHEGQKVDGLEKPLKPYASVEGYGPRQPQPHGQGHGPAQVEKGVSHGLPEVSVLY